MLEKEKNMRVDILKEAGYEEALLGLSLSFNADVGRMPRTAEALAPKDKGHNKFLESIVVYLDINAPRFWWSEFDTYRVGVTKQSESTMHTITRKPLCQDNFERPINELYLDYLNMLVSKGDIVEIKNALPDGYLQRRIVCTNYKALRGILLQRKHHRLPQWHIFNDAVLANVTHPELLGIGDDNEA